MADIYLSSVDGSDASNGLTWADAKATLVGALAVVGAGGRVFVDNAHSESTAGNITLTSPGTAASPVQILCVDRTGDPEPPTTLATTAIVACTSGDTRTISFAGYAYVYGVTFRNGDESGSFYAIFSFRSTASWWWRFEQCVIEFNSTYNGDTNAAIYVGSTAAVTNAGGLLELIDTDISFQVTNNNVRVQNGSFIWRGGSAVGAAPNTLIIPLTTELGMALVDGVDLSIIGSGKNLANIASTLPEKISFLNCKLGSSVSIATGTPTGQQGADISLVNCDSADTNYRYYRQNYKGTITQETVIVRTGGASDGVTPISRKMVTSANSKMYAPLESDPVLVWNEDTGSPITATIEIITDNVTLLNTEAWIEVEYLGTSGFPLSILSNDRQTALGLGTATDQASSSVDWTTTGITTPVKQKLEVTFTPEEKGPIRVRVMLAKASTTMYFDPKIDIT